MALLLAACADDGETPRDDEIDPRDFAEVDASITHEADAAHLDVDPPAPDAGRGMGGSLPHWAYGHSDGGEPDDGPSRWWMLDPAWQICMNDMHQSPLDLPVAPVTDDLPDLETHYAASHVAIANNGHTIQFDYDAGSTIRIGSETFALLQFHFHAPSEHAVGGVHHPLELHLVHRAESGKLAVLGVFLDVGDENPTLTRAGWASLPALPKTHFAEPLARYDASELVPPGPTYRYGGSLTTPPCTEGVAWHVKREPITLSAAQLAQFTAIYPLSARPLQTGGARVVQFGE